jgi:hypothetical protein
MGRHKACYIFCRELMFPFSFPYKTAKSLYFDGICAVELSVDHVVSTERYWFFDME